MIAHDNEVEKKDILRNYLIRLNFKLASKIIAQNEYQYDFFKKHFSKNRYIVIKKGIDFNNVITTNKNEKWDAVWVGRCEKWKMPEIFLELASGNPDYKFVMVCPPATNKNEYFKKIKKKSNKILQILSQHVETYYPFQMTLELDKRIVEKGV